MEVGLLLEMAAGSDPARPAVTGTDGRALTRGELHAVSQAAAARFASYAPPAVAFLGPNHLAFPVALFGAAIAGLPFVPLNYRLSDEQLRGLARRNPGGLVVAAPDAVERAQGLASGPVLDCDDLLKTAGAGGEPAGAVDPDAVAVVLYTSGTTAAPKAAVLRHRHLTSYVVGTVEFDGAEAGDAALVSVPPYHVAGVSAVLSNLYGGRRIVYLDPFEPARWLETVAAEEITHAMLVPTMLARVVEYLDGAVASTPTLRSLAYGGAKTPRRVLERALDAFPDTDFANAYGLTETSSTVAVLGPEDHRLAAASDDPAVRARLGSVGRPLPGVEVDVRDGEIFVRGEQVAGEYLETEGAGDDGWFATRDRGWVDGDGYLFIEGRADDTIIRGGENIAPAEIEDVLLLHDDVAECAVVGLPDDEWGQTIAAAVVLRPGATLDIDELRAWARERLRGSKTPDTITAVAELPYTETGKLLRRVVRDELLGASPSA